MTSTHLGPDLRWFSPTHPGRPARTEPHRQPSQSASSFLSWFIRVRSCCCLCHRPTTRVIAWARARRLRVEIDLINGVDGRRPRPQQGRERCPRRKRSPAPGATGVKESPRRLKRESSSKRRYTTSARASTVRGRASRPSPSACRRLGVQG